MLTHCIIALRCIGLCRGPQTLHVWRLGALCNQWLFVICVCHLCTGSRARGQHRRQRQNPTLQPQDWTMLTVVYLRECRTSFRWVGSSRSTQTGEDCVAVCQLQESMPPRLVRLRSSTSSDLVVGLGSAACALAGLFSGRSYRTYYFHTTGVTCWDIERVKMFELNGFT